MVLGTWNRVNQPSICHFKLLHSLKTLPLASRTWYTRLISLFSCRPLLLSGPCSIVPYPSDVGRMEVSLHATPLVRGGAGIPMPGTPPALRGRASWVWARCSSRGTAVPSLLPSQARVPEITTRGTHGKRDFPQLLHQPQVWEGGLSASKNPGYWLTWNIMGTVVTGTAVSNYKQALRKPPLAIWCRVFG